MTSPPARTGPEIPTVGGPVPLEAVLFDAGLTLIRAASSTADVAAPVLRANGIPYDWDALSAVMARAEDRLEAQWLTEDWFASEAAVRRLFVSAYEAALASLPSIGGVEHLATALSHQIYDSYLDARHWSTYPDVLPTLQALHEAHVAMGVVSDWGHGLEAIILELELAPFFQFLVVSSRLGITKPDPSVFQMALARIGARPEHSIYVGDTYVKDVIGARAAGLTPVLLDRRGAAPTADCLVAPTLTAILRLVGLPGL
ncbi:MAG: HAD family hydrolase [Anaerolineae bacterium]